MSNKVTAYSETASKSIIHKRLAKAYLDTQDYEKLVEIIDILKSCDKVAKEVLYFGVGKEGNDT